jgi:hypothetical protein
MSTYWLALRGTRPLRWWRLIDDLLLRREAVERGYADREEVLRETKSFEEGLLRGRLYEAAILPQVRTTDEDVEKYYRDHPDEFTLPERANISHILLKTSEEAEEVLSELKGGVDFGHLALTRSADRGTSPRLGKIGWVARGGLDPDFERAAFSLNVGETSGIVETRFGFHIVRLEGRKEKELMDLSRVKGLAHKKVLDKKRRERAEYWTEKLRERSDIVINEERVEEVQKALMGGKVPVSETKDPKRKTQDSRLKTQDNKLKGGRRKTNQGSTEDRGSTESRDTEARKSVEGTVAKRRRSNKEYKRQA